MSSLARVGQRMLGTRQVNQLVRFAPVLDRLTDVTPGRLLDVGSGSTGIEPLLRPGWTVVSLDADFSDYGALLTGKHMSPRVLGDVARLPFADRSFDAVVAIDLLEHVAPEVRVRAVDELCRVASHRVVIACPTGAAAFESDQRIHSALVARGSTVPPWLVEHLDNGFPETSELTERASRHGVAATSGNESTTAHERITLAELRISTGIPLRLCARVLSWCMRGATKPQRAFASRVVNQLGGHDREPTYRSVVCVDVDPGHSLE
jgi:SAM-dependent methyltransferase